MQQDCRGWEGGSSLKAWLSHKYRYSAHRSDLQVIKIYIDIFNSLNTSIFIQLAFIEKFITFIHNQNQQEFRTICSRHAITSLKRYKVSVKDLNSFVLRMGRKFYSAGYPLSGVKICRIAFQDNKHIIEGWKRVLWTFAD